MKVEWKHIWEVTTWDKKFLGVDSVMQPKIIKYHYYLANELTGLERQNGDVRILYTTAKVAYADSSEVEGTIAEGEVVTIPWGGNVNIQYYNGKFITADNRIATSNDTLYLSNKFLYYWMLSKKKDIEKLYRGAGIKHPSMFAVLSKLIPIPPLSEQQRIVEILDTFTNSIENLRQQIAERKKQFVLYRDKLLDLEGEEGEKKAELISCCEIKRGVRVVKRDLEEGGNIPVYQNSLTPLGFYDKSNCTGSTPFIIIGGAAGDIGYSKVPFWAADDCLCIIGNDRISSKFVYYVLMKNQLYFKSQVRKAGVPRLSRSVVEAFPISLPPLSEQQRIVEILDTFEASIKNLEEQLELRQKEYEYYRNKLLTFDK